MADAAGTVAVVEKLAVYPSANRTSPTSGATGESLVVGPSRSNPYRSPPAKIIGAQASRFHWGSRGGASAVTDVCRLGILFTSRRQPKADEWLSFVSYRSDEQGFIVWGRTRNE